MLLRPPPPAALRHRTGRRGRPRDGPCRVRCRERERRRVRRWRRLPLQVDRAHRPVQRRRQHGPHQPGGGEGRREAVRPVGRRRQQGGRQRGGRRQGRPEQPAGRLQDGAAAAVAVRHRPAARAGLRRDRPGGHELRGGPDGRGLRPDGPGLLAGEVDRRPRQDGAAELRDDRRRHRQPARAGAPVRLREGQGHRRALRRRRRADHRAARQAGRRRRQPDRRGRVADQGRQAAPDRGVRRTSASTPCPT